MATILKRLKRLISNRNLKRKRFKAEIPYPTTQLNFKLDDFQSLSAILSGETKVALFYLSSLAHKFLTARSRVVKQSFF